MRIGRGRSSVVLVCVLLSFGGCSEQGEQSANVQEIDSAGVRILTSLSPVWMEGDAWTVLDQPDWSLGSVEGDGPESFGRLGDVRTLPGGHLLVSDRDAMEIRVFSTEREYRGSIGREGDGPGELQAISSIQFLGPDTVLVFDRATQRLSRFLVSGELVSSQQLGQLEFRGAPVEFDRVLQLDDGSLVGREAGDFVRSEAELARDTVHFLIADDTVRLLDAMPGLWTVQAEFEGRRLFGIQMFNQLPTWDVLGNQVVVAQGDHYAIRVLERGGVERIVRRSAEPLPLTQADIEAFIEQSLARVPEAQRSQARRLQANMPYPEYRATYQSVLVDPEGNAWAEHYGELPGQPGPVWDVFDLQVGFLGSVEIPSGFRPEQVGLDWVLGVWTDPLGVQYVRMHRLHR